MIKKIQISLLFFVVLSIGNLFSQCSMVEIPLMQRIQNSTLIFEGKVVHKNSFWNNEHTRIYTSNTIELYKLFKGIVNSSTIELITEGGEIGNKKHVINPSLVVEENETGVFFGFTNSIPNSSEAFLMAYADEQGFVKYDVTNHTANDPFKKYNDVTVELYNVIQQQTGKEFSFIKSDDLFNITGQAKSLSNIQSITSFSPTSITAGTNSILTINGSGFGSIQGSSVVQFKNADDGGSTYIQPAPSHYLAWSNTQIQVVVPAKTGVSGSAGTGTIQVVVNSNPVTSSGTLTINYNELNLASSGSTFQTNHINSSNNGGYDWQMYSAFDSNGPAKASFIRAFTTWRCNTYINWQLSSTLTSINTIANDGTNVIRFDIGSELPVGVLGRCSSYWSSCGGGVWYVNELDIVFDDATTWNYTTSAPTNSESDFESVALHELGHGHQLGHVINSNDVMNYSLTVGTSRRVLTQNNLDAGNDVMSRNVVNNSCGPTHMIALTPGNCAVGAPTAAFTASPTSSCSVPTAVTFTDQSTGSPTSWAWDIDNNGTIDYTTQSPSHSFTNAGTYSVKLIVTNNNGSDTLIKTSYITLGSASLPYTEDFEASTFPPTSWSISGSPSDAMTWERDSLATGNGSSTGCAVIKYFNYNTSGGEKDNLITKPINLTGVTTAKLKYRVSYKNFPNSANYDSLRIYVSTDCGSSFGSAVKFYGGTSLATNGSDANEFTPGIAGDWRTDSVLLNTFVGNNIVIKFEGTNRYGNDLYLDDVMVTGTATAKPVVHFVTSDSLICVGNCVGFTDQSTNTPTAWAWTFTGATTPTSTAQNPTNICYATAGTYAVKLVATNGGGSDSLTKTTYIVVDSFPHTPVITQNGNVLTSSVTGVSYQWSLNGNAINGANAISFNALNTGNYTVTVSNSSGCSTTSAIYNFTFTPIPLVHFVASDSVICVGDCIGFTDQSTNTPTSWRWIFTGASTATSILQNPTNICYTAAGTYAVKLVATNLSGADSLTKTTYIVVDSFPSIPVISQNVNVLTSSVVGASYQWSLNGNAINGANSISYYALSSGNYTVSVSVSNSSGCTSTSIIYSFTYSPIPLVQFMASDSIICVGDCIGFTDQSTNTPTSWTWTFTGASTATSTSQNPSNICFSTAGTYAVKLVASNLSGADSSTKTAYIVVDSFPHLPVITQNSNVLTSSVIGASYQWSLNGNAINGASSVSYTATSGGDYTVTVTNASGCSTTSAIYNFNSNSVGLSTNNQVSVLVYPNPFNTIATIEIKGLSNPNGELYLYDLVGKLVLKSQITNSSSELHRENLAEGTYIYKVYNQGQLIGKGKLAIK